MSDKDNALEIPVEAREAVTRVLVTSCVFATGSGKALNLLRCHHVTSVDGG
jgi:hypothetical protein